MTNVSHMVVLEKSRTLKSRNYMVVLEGITKVIRLYALATLNVIKNPSEIFH